MMSKKKLDLALNQLAESAFDFLEKSVDEIKDHPKYSVIHFATAVELILKARLMREHWTLVVDRASDASLQEFLSGQCKTVTQSDAIKRLNNVSGENIPRDAIVQFGKIAAHRNRMVHFFHEAGAGQADALLIESIVKEQCHGWFFLERILAEWRDQFEEFEDNINSVRWRMKQNREFLSVAFDRLKPEIDAAIKSGTAFQDCSGCGYEAAAIEKQSAILFERHCRVCGLRAAYIEVPCPSKCGATIHIEADHGSNRVCETCKHKVTGEELFDLLDTEDFEESLLADYKNCAFCSGYHSVVQHYDVYICTECLSTEDSAPLCDWCHERQIGGGDLEFSYYHGCEFCEGQAGWTKDD